MDANSRLDRCRKASIGAYSESYGGSKEDEESGELGLTLSREDDEKSTHTRRKPVTGLGDPLAIPWDWRPLFFSSSFLSLLWRLGREGGEAGGGQGGRKGWS